MGHHDGAHGRVFRGMRAAGQRSDDHTNNAHRLAHRQVAPSHNTNGDKPVMHIPEGFAAQKAQADDSSNDDSGVETVYEQVFKTLEQTFDGPPQFFTTMEPTTTSSVEPAVETTAAAANSRQGNDNDEDQTPSRKPVAQTTATSSASVASSAPPTPSSSSATQQAAVSSAKPSTTASAMDITSSSIQTGEVTYTHGAKAADNTSSMIGGTPISATHSAVAEPQETGMTSGAKAGLAMGVIFGLALVFGLLFFCWRRKKSQRGLEEFSEKNVLATPPVHVNRFSSDSDRLRRTSTQTSATAPRLSLRPVTQFLPNLTSNAAAPKATQNPFGDAAVVSEKGHERTESADSVASAATATTATAEVVTAAAVPVARGPNNVHRVQLEFKPSMEVRMLHEYDDGWVSQLYAIHLLQAQRLTSFSGTLHKDGPQSEGCCPTHMPVQDARQASRTATSKRFPIYRTQWHGYTATRCRRCYGASPTHSQPANPTEPPTRSHPRRCPRTQARARPGSLDEEPPLTTRLT
jgi:hypothetical protein